MSRSFNYIRRVWHGLFVDPFFWPAMLGYGVSVIIASATTNLLWLAIGVGWVAVILVLMHSCPRGRPHRLARLLTPHFYCVRFLSNRWTVFQRRATAKKEQPDCRLLLKDLVAEQIRLPDALLPGRYVTITHDTVLHRLKKMQNARVLSEKPIYTSTMAAICSAMTGGRCKKCKNHCAFATQRKQARQFYKVEFEIISA